MQHRFAGNIRSDRLSPPHYQWRRPQINVCGISSGAVFSHNTLCTVTLQSRIDLPNPLSHYIHLGLPYGGCEGDNLAVQIGDADRS